MVRSARGGIRARCVCDVFLLLLLLPFHHGHSGPRCIFFISRNNQDMTLTSSLHAFSHPILYPTTPHRPSKTQTLKPQNPRTSRTSTSNFKPTKKSPSIHIPPSPACPRHPTAVASSPRGDVLGVRPFVFLSFSLFFPFRFLFNYNLLDLTLPLPPNEQVPQARHALPVHLQPPPLTAA